MLASVAAGLAGIAAAFLLTLPGTANLLKSALPRLHALVNHKFYVDELYGLLLIRPLKLLSGRVLFSLVDAGLIDGLLVNGSAKASYTAGKALARLQNGRLDLYALVFAIGVAAMLFWII